MRKIVVSGKAGGILTLNTATQKACLNIGATFVATQIDVTLFAAAMLEAARQATSLLVDLPSSQGR